MYEYGHWFQNYFSYFNVRVNTKTSDVFRRHKNVLGTLFSSIFLSSRCSVSTKTSSKVSNCRWDTGRLWDVKNLNGYFENFNVKTSYGRLISLCPLERNISSAVKILDQSPQDVPKTLNHPFPVNWNYTNVDMVASDVQKTSWRLDMSKRHQLDIDILETSFRRSRDDYVPCRLGSYKYNN